MTKNKILKIIIFSLIIIFIGSASVIASSNFYTKNKIDILSTKLTSHKNELDKKNTEETKELKPNAIDIGDLNTEDEYKIQLQELLDGCKVGLLDSKREQETDYSEKRQAFIDKMERKINAIESEMKKNENSTTISYKDLLERLLDHSDIDN